jgi:hypothetical protein
VECSVFYRLYNDLNRVWGVPAFNLRGQDCYRSGSLHWAIFAGVWDYLHWVFDKVQRFREESLHTSSIRLSATEKGALRRSLDPNRLQVSAVHEIELAPSKI